MTAAIRNILSALTLATLSPTLGAQAFRPVDYNALDVDISFNPGAYEQLLERFEQADASLGADDLSTVYYGFVCSPGYDPDADCADVAEAIDAARWNEAFELALAALDLLPVSLDLNTKATIAASHLTDSVARIDLPVLSARVDMLVTAILGSGLGTIPDAPFYVISYDDALAMVREVFGATAILGRSSVGPVDAIKFTLDDPDREHILYFKTYNNDKQRNSDIVI